MKSEIKLRAQQLFEVTCDGALVIKLVSLYRNDVYGNILHEYIPENRNYDCRFYEHLCLNIGVANHWDSFVCPETCPANRGEVPNYIMDLVFDYFNRPSDFDEFDLDIKKYTRQGKCNEIFTLKPPVEDESEDAKKLPLRKSEKLHRVKRVLSAGAPDILHLKYESGKRVEVTNYTQEEAIELLNKERQKGECVWLYRITKTGKERRVPV